MAQILFIEPELRTDKLGILYLAAVLRRAGHAVDLAMVADAGEAIAAVERAKPTHVMYSVTTGNHRWYIETNNEVVTSARNRHSFITVVGGPHYTFFPADGLNDDAVDYVVRGPGEAVIVDLVENPPIGKEVMGVVPDVEALPIGGVVWTPHEEVKFDLVFPHPRISRRIHWPWNNHKENQDWLYLAGEFAGDAWAIERADGADDQVVLSDYRVILGLERRVVGGLSSRFEVGYVFSRRIRYTSGTPDYWPTDTVMLRGGLSY